jgi:hypothetical protein
MNIFGSKPKPKPKNEYKNYQGKTINLQSLVDQLSILLKYSRLNGNYPKIGIAGDDFVYDPENMTFVNITDHYIIYVEQFGNIWLKIL